MDRAAPRVSVRLLVLLAAAVLAPSALAAEGDLIGTVVRATGGDTIEVRIDDHIETVRYIGVRAPALHHATRGAERGAGEAAEFNRRLVDGETVRLQLDAQERDEQGRLLAYVYVGDVMVNAELVKEGHGRALAIRPNVRHQELFRKLEREARVLQLGIWGGGAPGRARGMARNARVRDTTLTCPGTQPIKGTARTASGERCIYYTRGDPSYERIKARRCYATEDEALRDGCRAPGR